jgi:hypothetical protein
LSHELAIDKDSDEVTGNELSWIGCQEGWPGTIFPVSFTVGQLVCSFDQDEQQMLIGNFRCCTDENCM